MFDLQTDIDKASQKDTDKKSNPENSYQAIFNNLVKEQLLQNYHNKSGCFGCAVDHSFKVPFEDRIIFEVDCKGIQGTHFCEKNETINYQLFIGDQVLIECGDGIDLAIIKDVDESVKIKRQKLGLHGESLPKIIRKVSKKEIEKISQLIEDEKQARILFKEKANKLKLEMKLVDTHYQFDRKKLYFFYTAENRIDFRELARDLASVYRTRIELRQIGLRDEAKRIGGIGSCGREYCCNTFLSSSKNNGSFHVDGNGQNKFNGPCNKAKCCSGFEGPCKN